MDKHAAAVIQDFQFSFKASHVRRKSNEKKISFMNIRCVMHNELHTTRQTCMEIELAEMSS